MSPEDWTTRKYPAPPASEAFALAEQAIHGEDSALLLGALELAAKRGQADAPFLRALFDLALPKEGGGESLWGPIIGAGLPLDGIPRMEFLPLSLAIRRGNADACEALLAAGADPNGRNAQSDAPLLAALKARRMDLLALCLERGADPSLADDRGFTALHLAAADGAEPYVRALLLAGANPNALALESLTPADIALDCDQPAAAALIRAFCEEAELRQDLHEPPLAPAPGGSLRL